MDEALWNAPSPFTSPSKSTQLLKSSFTFISDLADNLMFNLKYCWAAVCEIWNVYLSHLPLAKSALTHPPDHQVAVNKTPRRKKRASSPFVFCKFAFIPVGCQQNSPFLKQVISTCQHLSSKATELTGEPSVITSQRIHIYEWNFGTVTRRVCLKILRL